MDRAAVLTVTFRPSLDVAARGPGCASLLTALERTSAVAELRSVLRG